MASDLHSMSELLRKSKEPITMKATLSWAETIVNIAS